MNVCAHRSPSSALAGFSIIPMLICALLSAQFTQAQPARPAGTPAIAGTSPECQEEQDWVDNRWSRTDVGNFLASSLKVPNGMVTKSLSIRLGDQGEAAVCFDLASLNIRAAWTGGFLKFDPARFGLLNLPVIDGNVQFVAPNQDPWNVAHRRFDGFHVHETRVVLDYTLGETRVRETPWYEPRPNGGVFLRSFEVGPGQESLQLRLIDRAKVKNVNRQQPNTGRQVISLDEPSGPIEVCLLGQEAKLLATDIAITIQIPSRSQPIHFTVAISHGKTRDAVRFAGDWQPKSGAPDLDALSQPSNARWLPALNTVGTPGPDTGPLAIDTLTVPYANPWQALMFLSGVDFDSQGAAYVCSIHGDVWKVTGIDDSLRKLTWHRFATGFYQALGLKVVHDEVYVLGRDQISRLHDQNGDGEADWYEDFCNLIQTIPEPHHFVTSLEADAQGNLYYVDPVGVHRVTPNGRNMETLATGFRNPNGMGVRPDGGVVTVAPQQGEWTPSSPIVEVQPGGYYGYGGPKITADRPLGYDPVLCWVPHSVDNSGGSQVWIPEGKWGALGGHFIHLSWGRCFMMLLLRDVVDGTAQAAAAPLLGRFLSGAMRGAFNPRDGALYVVGSTGWQTSALKDGSFQRVRFTGKPLDIPVTWHVQQTGITLTFAEPLDRETAADAGSYAINEWNYKYAASYGSKDWSVAHPGKEGHDALDVRSAKLLDDGKSVFLEVPELKQVMQLEIQYNVDTKSGGTLRNTIYGTINRLGSAR